MGMPLDCTAWDRRCTCSYMAIPVLARKGSTIGNLIDKCRDMEISL
jgi:hypothetical protein